MTKEEETKLFTAFLKQSLIWNRPTYCIDRKVHNFKANILAGVLQVEDFAFWNVAEVKFCEN